MTTKLLGSNIQGQYQAQMKQLKQQKAKDKEEKQQIEDKLQTLQRKELST